MQTILDIYVLRTFQWYKKLHNSMGFDSCNHSMKIWKSIGIPTPKVGAHFKVGAHLGVWGFMSSHSPTLPWAWDVTPGLLLLAHTLTSPFPGREPKVRVTTQNPIVYYHSSALGSSILDELVSQIMLGPPSQNAWKRGELKKKGKTIQGRPTLLIITKGGWSSYLTIEKCHHGSKMSSTKHVSDLGMSQYVLWSTFRRARLVHSHRKRWACEPTTATTICTGSLI